MWWLKLIGVYLFGSGLAQVAASLQRLRGSGNTPQPFQTPTVQAGTPINVLYGTAPIQPVLTWLGFVGTDPVFSYDNPLIGGVIHFAGPQQVKVAYAYRVTMQGVLGWGKMSSPINIIFGDRRLLSNEPAFQNVQVQGPTTADVGYIQVPTQEGDWFALEELHGGRLTVRYCVVNAFGGIGRGGGFGCRFDALGHPIGGGEVTFAMGSRQYGPDPTMQRLINPGGVDDPENNVPTYGDLATVVYENVVVGESPTAPPVRCVCHRDVDHAAGNLLTTSFVASRIISYQGGPGWSVLEPTHIAMLYDAMRSSKYGAGVRAERVDGASWEAAITQAYGEGFHGSWLVGGDGRQLRLSDLRDEVEKVVDGQAFESPVTRLWKFTLNRDEAATPDAYAALPTFDERHFRDLEWFEAQPSEVINQVTVEFFNAAKLWTKDTVTLTNWASVGVIGLKPQTITLVSVTDPDVALIIAARELRRGSANLARGKAIGTRVFWSAEPGSVFKLSHAKYGLNGLVVRIASIDYGTPENGEIRLELVEDLFGHDAVTYSGVETPPVVTNSQIVPPTISRAVTTVDGTTGHATLTLVDPQHRVIELAVRKQTGTSDATEWSVLASATPDTSDPTFPFNENVTLGDLAGQYVVTLPLASDATSAVAYRVRYIGAGSSVSDPLADVQEIMGEISFAAVPPPAGPTITLSATISAGVPTVTARVGPGVGLVRFLGTLGTMPTESDVRTSVDAVNDATAPFQIVGPALGLGDVYKVGAIAIVASGATAFATIEVTSTLSTPYVYTRSRTNYFQDASKTVVAALNDPVYTWGAAPGTTRDLVHRYPGIPGFRPLVQQDGAAVRFGDELMNNGPGIGITSKRGAFVVPDMSAFTEAEIILVVQRAAAPVSDFDGGALFQLGAQGNDGDYFPSQSDGHWRSTFGSTKNYDIGPLASAIINGTDGPHVIRLLSSATRWAAYLDGNLEHEDLSPSPAFDQTAPVLGENVLGGHFNGWVWTVLLFDAVNSDAQADAWTGTVLSDAIGAPPPGDDDDDGGGPPPVGGAAGDEGDVQYNNGGVLAGRPFRDFGRWEPLTNADPDDPDLLYADGDVVMAFRPGP